MDPNPKWPDRSQFTVNTDFSSAVALLLERTDYRRIVSGQQREAIFRLRYEAYKREGANSATISDRYDEAANAFHFGLYVDGKLGSSIRLHVASKEHDEIPSSTIVPDVLRPELQVGTVLIESSRMVVSGTFAEVYRALPYATLRLGMLAAEHFHGDHLIVAAKRAHQPFYQRAFNYRPISDLRHCPNLATPIRVMMLDYSTGGARQLYRRYPFFRSTFAERWKVFEQDKVTPGAF